MSHEPERNEVLPLVVLEPARSELGGEMREAYDALVEDITQLGFEVELREAIERQRGGTTFTAPLADLVVYVKQAIEDQLVEAIAAAIVARVGAHPRWPRKRTLLILGADGETVLRRVRLSEPE
jgi:hypothetical protein